MSIDLVMQKDIIVVKAELKRKHQLELLERDRLDCSKKNE